MQAARGACTAAGRAVRVGRGRAKPRPGSRVHSDAAQPDGSAQPLLRLPRLASPAALRQQWWQQGLRDACLRRWQAAGKLAPGVVAADAASSPAPDAAAALVLALDALLLLLQQAASTAGHIARQHASADWRAAGAEAFVAARQLERDVCGDAQLHAGLVAAAQQLSRHAAAATGGSPTSPGGGATAPETDPQQLCHLCSQLLRHFDLEGGAAQRPGPNASVVLSAAERSMLLDTLQAQERQLSGRLQALVGAWEAAPILEAEQGALQELLAPLLAGSATAAAAQQLLAAAASDPPDRLLLSLPLVQLVLQHHPDTFVREQVYDAGLLGRLDGVLTCWQELAEVRRKLARWHGHGSCAAWALQGSLVGAPGEAVAFLQQLCAALNPPAMRAAKQLDAGGGLSAELRPWDVDWRLQQERDELLGAEQAQQLQPFLQLPSVLQGLSSLLETACGLRLQPRDAEPGELWAAGVLVWELWDCGAAEERTAGVAASTSATADPAPSAQAQQPLGTIYVNPSGGYGTRMLHHGVWPAEGASAGADGAVVPLAAGLPAVAVGLQSVGELAGADMPLALWELLHEMGHALHYVLSSRASGAAAAAAARLGAPQQPPVQPPQQPGSGQQPGSSPPLLHAHATWLPLELQELPSTLMEELCMQPACLQRLCRHSDTGAPLPAELATRLAARMRAQWYHPVAYQQLTVLMLVDQRLAGWGRRQPAQAAHRGWQAAAAQTALPPGATATLGQVLATPRAVSTHGRGYAYLYAWVLSNLLKVQLFGGPGAARGLPSASAGRAVRRWLLEGAGRRPPAEAVQQLLAALGVDQAQQEAMMSAETLALWLYVA